MSGQLETEPALGGGGSRSAGSHGGTEAQEPAAASVPKGADGITLATIAPP